MSDAARIEELVADFAANRLPGGSAFARRAAELIALRTLAQAGDVEAVRRAVSEVSHWVVDTRPSMAVVRNVADLALTLSADTAVDDPAQLKGVVATAMRDYIDRSERAMIALAQHAQTLITADCSILVHSYSASLETLLRAATVREISFRLLVTESRPYRESRRLIGAIAHAPVDIVLYSDAAVCTAVEAADLALVGADTVYTDGSFANKTGSRPLALACRDNDVPLYVATELAKVYFGDTDDIEMELRPAGELADGWPLIESGRVQVWNQFFERVDARYVCRYLTEEGPLVPEQMHTAAARAWIRLAEQSGEHHPAPRPPLPVS